jgi:hypothetical protein
VAVPIRCPVARAVRRFSSGHGKASWTTPATWLENLFE